MDTVARHALDHGYHTINEGIFAAHCTDMLTALRKDHRGGSRFYYLDAPSELDVPFEEPSAATPPNHRQASTAAPR